MSSSIKLYTIPAMEEAVIDSATSEATGFPKENMADNNPDTYWKPTSTADQTIIIDLQSAFTIDALIVFIKDYLTLTGTSTAQIYRYWSDNGTDWTFITGTPNIGSLTAGPLRISEGGMTAVGSHQYWKFVFLYLNEPIEVAGLWLCKNYDLGQGDQWPENDRDSFSNISIKGHGGRLHTIGINRRRNLISPRQYIFNNSTVFEKLRDAYNDSRGNLWPLIIQEGTLYSDARLVRFGDKSFGHAQESDGYYRPSVQFADVPYIRDGDTY